MVESNPFIAESSEQLTDFRTDNAVGSMAEDMDAASLVNSIDNFSTQSTSDRPRPSSLKSRRQNANRLQQQLDAFAETPTSSDYISAPVNFNYENSNAARYVDSKYYKQIGFDPFLSPDQNEFRYGAMQTWGDTMSQAFGGAKNLAIDTFIEGWKGWGRMTEALFTLDSSKLMGSPEEREEMAKQQEDIFNKYAIYDTAESRESIFNRQFFGNMLQQSGFMLGAMGQMVLETYLTAGFGSVFSGLGKAATFGKSLKYGQTASELLNDTRKVVTNLSKTERVTNAISEIPRALIPLYGTIQDITRIKGAGAGMVQMGMLGLGGIKRELSMFNMARSEAIFESASTYADLRKRLTDEYIEKTGEAPTLDIQEKINQKAEDASHDNFWTNTGILSVMNRIQFDNMIKSFNPTRNLFTNDVSNIAEQAFKVTGKIGDKSVTQAFKKGFFGEVSAIPKIAGTFGKKTAAWEATKMLGKGMMKFEGTEGLQELIQEASNKGLSDYYYDLYHGNKGYGSRTDAVLSSIKNPFTDTDGMKTFLMGALTGRMLSPITGTITKVSNSLSNRNKKQSVDEDIKIINDFLKNPSNEIYTKEWIANTKVQNKAAESMAQAVANGDKYQFHNAKNSAFAKAVAASIKLNMYDSLKDSLLEMGQDLNEEQFKEAFGFDPSKENKKTVKTYMKEVVDKVEDYHNTYTQLRTKYADLIIPELYKNNGDDEYTLAKQAKKVLDDSIEMLTTNLVLARQTLGRAVDLQQKVASKPTIGASSSEVFLKMASETDINFLVKLLEEEVSSMEKNRVNLNSDQKNILTQKKKELRLVSLFQSAMNEVLNKPSDENDLEETSQFPANESRAYDIFQQLLYFYNDRNNLGNKLVIEKSEIDDAFISFVDYVKLNRDSQDYTDAANTLINPRNLLFLARKMYEGRSGASSRMADDHVEEIKNATSENTDDKDSASNFPEGSLLPKDSIEALVLTPENYNNWSNVRDMSDYPAFVQQVRETLANFDTVSDKKTITPENVDNVLSSIKAFSNKDIRDQVVKLIVEKYNPDFYTPSPTSGKKPKKDMTRDEIVRYIKSINDPDAISKFLENLEEESLKPGFKLSGSDLDLIFDEGIKRIDELSKSATSGDKSPSLSLTDPLFVQEYNLVRSRIESVLRNPDSTEKDIRDAYTLLNPVVDKLNKEDRNKIIRQHRVERDEAIRRAIQIADSKDYNKQRSSINEIFKLNLSLRDINDRVFDIINVQAHQSIKANLIEYFEGLYLNMVSQRITALRKNANKSGLSSIRAFLIKSFEQYGEQILQAIDLIDQNTKKLKDKMAGIQLNVDTDSTFENSVHKSILSWYNGDVTIGQQLAIDNLLETGIISQDEDIADDKHSASELINLGVARIHTLKVNKALIDLLKKPSKANLDRFKTLYKAYYQEGNIGVLQSDTDYIFDILENEVLKNKPDNAQVENYLNDILNRMAVPRTTSITDDQFKLLTEFLVNLYNIQSYGATQSRLDAISDNLSYIERKITNGDSIDLRDTLTEKLIDTVFASTFETKNNDEFIDDLMQLGKDVSALFSHKELKSHIDAFLDKHLKENVKTKNNKVFESRKMLESFVHMMLEAENKINNAVGTSSTVILEESQMIDAITSPSKSLSDKDIDQVEEFAKNKLLQEFKNRFNAAIGFQMDLSQFQFDYLEPEYFSVNVRFHSLRPKFADDTRSIDDLTTELGVEDDTVSIEKALNFVLKSRFATEAEKVLAEKLLQIVDKNKSIRIDNTLTDAGTYDHNTGEILINLKSAGHVERMPSVPIETVIIHELLHQITSDELYNDSSEYRKTISELYNIVKSHPNAGTYYAFRDGLDDIEKLAEFVVEAFTNPSFQHLLSSVQYKNTRKTLWERFMQIINDLLEKFGLYVDDNVLNEVVVATSELFEKAEPSDPEFTTAGDSSTDADTGSTAEDFTDASSKTDVEDEVKKDEVPLVSVYKDLYDMISAAKSEKELVAVRKLIRRNQRNKNLWPWQLKSLAAGMRAKKKSLNSANIFSKYIKANRVSVGNRTYRYIIEDDKFRIFTMTRAGIRDLRSAQTKEQVLKEILKKKKSYKNILTDNIKQSIYSITGEPFERGTYASNELQDGVSIGFARFRSFYLSSNDQDTIPISLNFSSKEEFNSFMLKYNYALRTRNRVEQQRKMEELRQKIGNRNFSEFNELFYMIGSISKIRELVNKKIISPERSGGYTITEVDNMTQGSLRDILDFVLEGNNLGESETEVIRSEVNEILSKTFGMKISKELQQEIENDLFTPEDYSSDDQEDDFDLFGSESQDDQDGDQTRSGLSSPPGDLPPTQGGGLPLPSAGSPEIIRVVSKLDPDVSIEEAHLNFMSVQADKTKAAQETYALRSKNLDIINNKETEQFKNFYYKVRNVINKLSLMEAEKHIDLYVTLIKGDELRVRWDGSAESTKQFFDRGGEPGVIGYISDINGNPIVFDKDGNRAGKVERNNLDDRKGLDNGVNQIVYFNTATADTKNKEKMYDGESLAVLLKARELAAKGIPQIARVVHFSQGQMTNVVIPAPNDATNSRQNTKNDQFYEQLMQLVGKNVSFEVNGKDLLMIIKDADGAVNKHALFPLRTSEVMVESDNYKVSLFDYMLMLMETYQQMRIDKHPKLTDVQDKLIKFLRNIWYTGDRAPFSIDNNLHTIEIHEKQSNGSYAKRTLHLFETRNGPIQKLGTNIDIARNFINRRNLNISKPWFDKTKPFLFPVVQTDPSTGKAGISFVEKDYFNYLLREVGMKTNILEIKPEQELKRYHSQVHFNNPWTLDQNIDVSVPTEEEIINDAGKIQTDAADTIEKADPSVDALRKKRKPGRWGAQPGYEVIYQKICK